MERQVRNQMVLDNLPLVGYLAAELCAKATHLSREDLASVGAIALITAADSFDDTLGVPFGAYARRRIVGAFADDMRSNDWATRGARKKITETRTVQDSLTAALGRTPTVVELSEALGLDQTATLAILSDSARTVVAIDDTMNDYLSSGIETPEESMLEVERTKVIRDAVAALPENLRVVIERIYFEGSTVKELAAEMGVTHSAVSQRRTAAMKLLHEGLQTRYIPDQASLPESSLSRAATQRREQYLKDFGERVAGGIVRLAGQPAWPSA
ncbi:RNA polymerase sigma factor FliA [Paeniglutamicibacter psychrophenolicus]|uniref:RNA polymerase sigma factor for flagellar operon FliA n=1 Tax=Paeniglutamicibacter psychrophenolicus TaxID=257454 RepID=A0ABS4WDC9_9MICC|nr:sigma-70 family RNA polymerase sigma factor [Paeniglutamicibacter psychrophenolicus]MBP2374051.1 RNA polymerase sigma factor for flagellar operon FliA [Paeniglutamicibacter psychrophenolicus]